MKKETVNRLNIALIVGIVLAVSSARAANERVVARFESAATEAEYDSEASLSEPEGWQRFEFSEIHMGVDFRISLISYVSPKSTTMNELFRWVIFIAFCS